MVAAFRRAFCTFLSLRAFFSEAGRWAVLRPRILEQRADVACCERVFLILASGRWMGGNLTPPPGALTFQKGPVVWRGACVLLARLRAFSWPALVFLLALRLPMVRKQTGVGADAVTARSWPSSGLVFLCVARECFVGSCRQRRRHLGACTMCHVNCTERVLEALVLF